MVDRKLQAQKLLQKLFRYSCLGSNANKATRSDVLFRYRSAPRHAGDGHVHAALSYRTLVSFCYSFRSFNASRLTFSTASSFAAF